MPSSLSYADYLRGGNNFVLFGTFVEEEQTTVNYFEALEFRRLHLHLFTITWCILILWVFSVDLVNFVGYSLSGSFSEDR